MSSARVLPAVEGVVAVVSFGMIFVTAVAGHLAVKTGIDQKTADVVSRSIMLLLCVVFGFACMGLLVHVFIRLQVGIGNGGTPMIRFLAQHETGVTLAFWGFLGLGTLVALPFALHDLAGVEFQMPMGRSQGILTADVGMTMEEVRRVSTLPVKDPHDMGHGSALEYEDVVFEFRMPGSTVHFPQSRYYWLETKNGNPRIASLNVGITPRKLPEPELEVFRHRVQSELSADGWMPAHFVAESEEVVRLWSGHRTTGDGRYWGKGNTLLIIETNRMDDEKRDEPAGSGEFILYLVLCPKSDHADLVYEPSAWTN